MFFVGQSSENKTAAPFDAAVFVFSPFAQFAASAGPMSACFAVAP